ncbi:MAG: Clp protease N-terminal domain-containing protein, partial [Bacillota bacterium]
MNLDNLTQNSIRAIQSSEKIAEDYSNPTIDIEHLILALLLQENGLIPNIIVKMDIKLTDI